MSDYTELVKASRMCMEKTCPFCDFFDGNGCKFGGYMKITLNAAAAIEALQAAQPHWVRVEERLPRNGQLVVVIDDDGHANTATLSAMGGWWLSNSNDFFVPMSRVLYWMPLPEPPKEDV